jgi:CheY-like chemotaxis protein
MDSKQPQAYGGMLNNPWGRCLKKEEGSRTALVVDDGAMCRKACGAMLQGMGFIVEFANDGRESVDKIFRENPVSGEIVVNYYDIVMMDNFMPIMDGSDAVTLLRLNGYMGTIIGLTYDIFDEPSKLFRYVSPIFSLLFSRLFSLLKPFFLFSS